MPDQDLNGIPPGWSYNPASWAQRFPIILLALAGAALASYLAAYQWRFIENVWEPFFGYGSIVILNSPVSHLLPVPDAALAALAFLFEAVAVIIGGPKRWRTMPWIVIVFGFAVGSVGLISVLLVIIQPIWLDAWCTLCLASALIAVLMIGPAMDEVLAALQHLQREKHRGRSLWRAFWGFA